MADKFSSFSDLRIFRVDSIIDKYQTDVPLGRFSIGTFTDMIDKDFILSQAFILDTSYSDVISDAEIQASPFWISSIVVNYVETITVNKLSNIVLTEDNIIGIQVIGDISDSLVPLTSYFCTNGKIFGEDRMILETGSGTIELSSPVIDSSSATFSINYNGLSSSEDIYFIVYKKSS